MDRWKMMEVYMGVSKNRATPKPSTLIGFSIINHPFWGFSPYFWKHPYLPGHHPAMPTMPGAKYVATGRGLPTYRRPFIGETEAGTTKLKKAGYRVVWICWAIPLVVTCVQQITRMRVLVLFFFEKTQVKVQGISTENDEPFCWMFFCLYHCLTKRMSKLTWTSVFADRWVACIWILPCRGLRVVVGFSRSYVGTVDTVDGSEILHQLIW